VPASLLLSLRQHLAAFRVLLVLTVITGIAYPLAVTGIAQVIAPHRANGSLVSSGGHTVGSSLLGQSFTDAKGNALPQWFQSRPSAAGATGYDPTASGASNLGPESSVLLKEVEARRAADAALDGVSPASVPPDALTASGSGLDPDISPAYAYEQVARIAKARNLDVAKVQALVKAHVDGRQLGFLGESTVNVLELNIALEKLTT
jgi:potassium-transporting ATPase KdpC subunit